MSLKNNLMAVSDKAGIFSFYGSLRRKISGSQTAILAYHRVSPTENLQPVHQISPAFFKQQIEYLSRNFEIISLERLASILREKKALPRKAVVLTFDDGYADCYDHVLPVLEEYHLPATVFLATGYIGSTKVFWWDQVGRLIRETRAERIDLGETGTFSLYSPKSKARSLARILAALKTFPEEKKNYLVEKIADSLDLDKGVPENQNKALSWEQVKEMSSRGISFGAHTVNHPVLTGLTREQAAQEILQSKTDIEKRLNRKIELFAYPYGIYNADLVRIVEECGFNTAVSYLSPGLIGRKSRVLQLSRISPMSNFPSFKARLSGLAGDLDTPGIIPP